MVANGQLVFTDVDKVTFKGVGGASNAVIDTTTGKIGVGVDSPDANLHVLGNCFVSTNFELGGTMTMGTVTVRAQHELSAITATGNTTPHTVEFTNAETSLVTTGNVSVGKELTVAGNVEVGTANLFVDTVNSRVGVGTSSPLETLDVYGGFLMRPERTTTSYVNAWTGTSPATFTAGSQITGPTINVIYSKNAIYTTAGGLKVSPPNPDTEYYYARGFSFVYSPPFGGYYIHFPVSGSTTSPYLSGDVFSSTRFKADNTEDFTGFAIGQDYQGGNTLNDYSQYLDIARAHSADMYFKTASPNGTLTEKMRITNAGNVGIGKTDPGAKLDVLGTIRVQTGTNDATGGEFSIDTNVGHIRRKVAGNGVSLTSYDDFYFYVNATGGSAEGGTQAMRITSSGNVGIGTTDPSTRLHVNHDLHLEASSEAWNTTVGKGLYLRYSLTDGQDTAYIQSIDRSNTSLSYPMIFQGSSYEFSVGSMGIGKTPSEKLHVHENLATSGHQIMARIGGDTSSYNTLVFGSKEGRPHIGGHRGDFGAWADLSLQNDSLIISQSGNIVNVNGTLRIQGYDTKRVLIGYQKYSSSTGVTYASGTSGYQDAWSVTYTRVHSGSQIYVIGDLCLAQAMGATGTTSYRAVIGRLKVNSGGVDYYSDSVQDWQRIDNSFHEYQRQSRVHFNQQALSGTTAGQNITIYAQVEEGGKSGTTNAFGLNIWSGRSYIEVFEVM